VGSFFLQFKVNDCFSPCFSSVFPVLHRMPLLGFSHDRCNRCSVALQCRPSLSCLCTLPLLQIWQRDAADPVAAADPVGEIVCRPPAPPRSVALTK
jgi:hypothetical protein